MFSIHCHICDEEHLVSTRNIVSMLQTSNGPVAFVRCVRNHLVMYEFRNARSSGPNAADLAVAV